jgi:DNA-binding NtrC family response regulator
MTAHVLVLDREMAICEVLKAALESGGKYRVSCAGTLEQARRKLTTDALDLLIVDVPWPFDSGLKLADNALEVGIPSIIITGEPEAIRKLSIAECSFLAKPFHLAALIEAMSTILRGDRRQNTARTSQALRRAIEGSKAMRARRSFKATRLEDEGF